MSGWWMVVDGAPVPRSHVWKFTLKSPLPAPPSPFRSLCVTAGGRQGPGRPLMQRLALQERGRWLEVPSLPVPSRHFLVVALVRCLALLGPHAGQDGASRVTALSRGFNEIVCVVT